MGVFEPIDLSEEITPKSIRATLQSKDYSRALIMALKMNETKLTREVYENGNVLQKRSPSTVAMLRAVQKSIGRKFEDLSKICHHNRYTLQYVQSLGRVHSKRRIETVSPASEDEEDPAAMSSDLD